MDPFEEYTIILRPFGSRKIYLDPGEEEGIYLYPSEAKKENLEDGMTLSGAQIEELRRAFALPRAKKHALHILLKRDQTSQQLREKLQKAGNDSRSIREALDFVRDSGYVDDARYASDYLASRRRKKSFRQIRMDLMTKGIRGEILDSLFEQERQEPEDLLDQMRKYASKFPEQDLKTRNKIYAHFYRKGYDSALISDTLALM